MKKKEAPKSTIEVNRSKKKPLYLGDYFCLKEMTPRPATDTFLDMLGKKLMQWAELPESLHIREFQQMVGVRDEDYSTWRKRYEPLQKAHDWAKALVGTRRELMALKRQLDPSMTKYTLHLYAPEYKEAAEFHAKLAKRDAEAVVGGVQWVVVPKIQSDDENFQDKK